MPSAKETDTIRILIATDNHVGYNERDPIRGDDSWKTFHEIMVTAKERDVDMVILAGDLFHENKPSRKSMYQVMRSLRMNCLGNKPCELEMLSDASESFYGAFNHINYEDPDINVAIPVFSIHGNHDDPSGEGHLAALDLLQMSGLVNYYGRTPESDNIIVKPILLQKGHTKLALYGMSNVRDERLFRTFRDGKVKFFQPTAQKQDWFNLMAVHQNHHAYTETGYLPEKFLPEFLDLVVWGHEHECLIDPRYNPEMTFRVMQPGSSVATSLMPGEAVPKHVAILNIVGKEFTCESIRLKSVRPFVMKEVVLQDVKEMRDIALQNNNRTKITRYLMEMVENLIAQARSEWCEAQDNSSSTNESDIPLPLIRLRVEYSAPEGGRFDCENPQRFSNRFVNKVANVNDVIQFYRKKTTLRKTGNNTELPEPSVLEQLSIDTVKVEKLVREFLTVQTLTILPQNSFGDAVSQFIDKDDKHAMETFVNESLSNQIKHLLNTQQVDEQDIAQAMDQYRSKLEELFNKGHLKAKKTHRLKPRPDNWDSDLDGDWADQTGALLRDDDEEESQFLLDTTDSPSNRNPGRSTAASRKTKTAINAKSSGARNGSTRRRRDEEDDEDDPEDNVVMVNRKSHNKAQKEQITSKPTRAPVKKATVAAAASRSVKSATSRQPILDFSQSRNAVSTQRRQQPSEDEISDDDDAFEPVLPNTRTTRGRK